MKTQTLAETGVQLISELDGLRKGITELRIWRTRHKQMTDLLGAQRDLGVSLNAVTELHEGIRLCVEAAIKASDMDCGGLYLVDKTSGDLNLVFHKGLELHSDTDSTPGTDSHYALLLRLFSKACDARVVMAGKPVYAQCQTLGVPLNEAELREGLRVVAVVPICYEGQVIGCLIVASHTLDQVPPFARDALEMMATQIGSAIARLEAEEELRKHRENLEDMVRERTAELAEVNEELQREIDERRRIEKSLRESRQRYKSVVNNIGFGVAVVNPDMEVLSLNDQMGKWFPGVDVSQKPVCYKALRDPPRTSVCSYCPIRKTLKNGRMYESTVEENVRGEIRYYRILSSPIRASDGEITEAVELLEDITDRKIMECQLAQAQKLESIGQLAAGVAHEINTPIQYVGDNTRFLQESLMEISRLFREHRRLLEMAKTGLLPAGSVAKMEEAMDEADVEYLWEEIPLAIQQSLEGIGQVSRIVQAMKQFSYPGAKEKMAIDINKAIESTVTIARNEWKYVAEVETDFDTDLPPVTCLPGEIKQAILNVIINAAHAIADAIDGSPESKGNITISTCGDGDWVEIRIRDTGTGIPQEIRSRIFDPFFTTKDVGKGTGQGLAILHNVVVEKHGGTIAFESEMDKGTTFIIRLPIGGAAESRGT